MTLLDSMVEAAYAAGASDLHLEPGLPPARRIRGQLEVSGEPVKGSVLLEEVRRVAGTDSWPDFVERRSLDLSRVVGGVRCRINAFQTSRGVSMAVRLLTAFQATLETLNLHPDLRELAMARHGLVLVSGPTGSGKSSTIAGLVQEINLAHARHIITIEQPIEHVIRPQRSFVRQREVGRDTPSFEQALVDALREDPDVIVVGEMREPEIMRLTLGAAETGHLVFSTVHSGSTVEALQRIVAAFPPGRQSSVCAQLAESLVAVVCQRLTWEPRVGLRVPECEILRATSPVKALVRRNQLAKLEAVITTSGAEGMWTFDRYRRWLQGRERFHVPSRRPEPGQLGPDPEPPPAAAPPPPAAAPPPVMEPQPQQERAVEGPPPPDRGLPPTGPARTDEGVWELDASTEDLESILDELK